MIKDFDKIIIENVKPEIDGGRYPIKKEVGDSIKVTADIFKDGHDILAALVKYRIKGASNWHEEPMTLISNDEWTGSFSVSKNTWYEYTIEAYTELFLSWRDEVTKKINYPDLTSEILEGLKIINTSCNCFCFNAACYPVYGRYVTCVGTCNCKE